MKMLELDIEVDEKSNEVGKLKGERMDLQENLKLVECINKYYKDLEEKEKEKRKRELNGNGGEAKKMKMVSIFPNLTKHS